MNTLVWIKSTDVNVTFGDRHLALANLNFQCNKGDFTAVVGPSGCGKSTLLRLIAGLQATTSGDLYRGWLDAPATVDTAPASREIRQPDAGFVFQQPNLLPWRNAIDNIALPLELTGISRAERLTNARRARELVGLAVDDEPKLPRMLSGGMKMRVSLARSIVMNPQVMLMDEPFSAVDDLLRSRLNEEISSLWYQQRWTTIFVTHHVQEAVFLSGRVVVMSSSPGTIFQEIEVPFPFPRRHEIRGTPEFARIAFEVTTALRGAGEGPP